MERIIQFGTGNFLRGFVCAFIDRLNKAGLYDGSVVIVSPTDSNNVDRINAQGGKYHLILRGKENGEVINERYEIGCVSRALNPYRDFGGYLALAENPELRFIISNTTEAGIAFDESCKANDRPAASFPAKLTQLLYRRFTLGLGGFIMLPCELIDSNADTLKEYVLRYARLWSLGGGFIEWINNENRFCNTLVDRIVTGYPKGETELIGEYPDDLLLDTAEPYHLWAIEGNCENEFPLKAGGVNVIWTDDISFYKKRKVRVLNGVHTSIVFPALLCGFETVGECLSDGFFRSFAEKCLYGCILPVLGETDENTAYAKAVLERFDNPFIRHQLRSIALNSVSKFRVRVLPTMLEYRQKNGCFPAPLVLSLAALIKYYRENEVSDSEEAVNIIRTKSVEEILKSDMLFGCDLSEISDAVSAFLNAEINEGIKQCLK